MAKTAYIAELLATLLQEDNGSPKAELALKQAGFMDDIQPWVQATIGLLVFCG